MQPFDAPSADAPLSPSTRVDEAGEQGPREEVPFHELLRRLRAKFDEAEAQNSRLCKEVEDLRAAQATACEPAPAACEPELVGHRPSRSDSGHPPCSSGGSSRAFSPRSAASFPKTDLDVLSCWQQQATSAPEASLTRLSLRGLQTGLSFGIPAERGLSPLWRRLVLPPESRVRLAWDSVSMLFLAFDIMHTPLMVFFDATSPFEFWMAVVTTTFWSLDIAMSFLRGYNSAVAVELRPTRIALHYLRREFLPDVLIVALDWTMVVYESSVTSAVSYSRLGKAFRFLRIGRTLRLVRVVKVTAFVDNLEAQASDFWISSVIHVTKTMLLILALNHVIACGWYAVGSVGRESWTEQAFACEDGCTIWYRYATSLHWAVTQFTPASMEVNPKNALERTYAIAVILVGLVMFSSFLSTITGSMTTLRVEHQRRMKQIDDIRRYVNQHGISVALSLRISAFVSAHRLAARGRVARKDVTLIRALPKNLKSMLDWEVYEPLLSRHAFLRHCAERSSSAMLQICTGAVQEVLKSPGEELFHGGEAASGMYIAVWGAMQYFQGFDEDHPQDILGRSGAIIAEHALWLRWVHQGRIFALTACSFLRLSPQGLMDALAFHPHLVLSCRAYARHLRARLQELLQLGEVVVVDMASTPYDSDLGLTVLDDLHAISRDAVQEVVQGSFAERSSSLPNSGKSTLSL
mmetsp:Transcript_64361/g.199285  ORF Transcript_64361/g.199285 Transcript_64361/m.199285 type:complete len:692 (+) Transcript_64361:104-2179(+)